MFIQTEATPNPATLKFLPGKEVLAQGTADFRDAEDAATASPLAGKLFAIPGVTGVFFGYDFVTVTKEDGPDWQHLKPAILGAIMEHFLSGAPVMASGGQAAADRADEDGEFYDEADAEIVRHHQGTARDPGAPGGCPGRRRHHLPRLRERHRVPAT